MCHCLGDKCLRFSEILRTMDLLQLVGRVPFLKGRFFLENQQKLPHICYAFLVYLEFTTT